jgi:preprotein translocase subunit SecE
MAKEKNVAGLSSFFLDLFNFGVYKRNQGRVVRQATFAALAVTLLLASWQLWALLTNPSEESWWYGTGMDYFAPGLVLLVGLWVSFRLVNYPQFADFLVAVEAEMNKVSWPSRTELMRSSMVVIFMMFFLAITLFGFDLAWRFLFQMMGVIQQSS